MPMLTTGIRRTSTVVSPRFISSRLDGVENMEDYQPGGFHPITIGDAFDQGRIKILHKLGFGGSSTVWLARDQRGAIVTLKALRADISSSSAMDQIPELSISQKLKGAYSSLANFHTVDHHFSVHGPNGVHTFLITPFAGPSIAAMYDCPGRVIGSRRLRADLARKVANQTADAINHMHRAGIAHGDLTTSNILFRPSARMCTWSDAEVYAHFGDPETETVRTRDGQPTGPNAPAMLVAPIQNATISHASFLEESITVSDFGQSHMAASPPPSYRPATLLHYMSPEARFTHRAGFEADVWSLGCAIFEIRAGFPLFESFLASESTILKQTVEMLGRLPDPWWDAFESRRLWFEENGHSKSRVKQERASVGLMASRTSIREKLLEIGKDVDPRPSTDEGPMIEQAETPVPEQEVDMLADLLEGMLRYRPEDRIQLPDVIRHPWFML